MAKDVANNRFLKKFVKKRELKTMKSHKILIELKNTKVPRKKKELYELYWIERKKEIEARGKHC